MITSSNFTLYLSSEGDSVEIKNFQDTSTIPEQLEAISCKTHKQVLAFLEKINSSETKDLLSFYHVHNTSYEAHHGTSPKGKAHLCSLDKQISFVQYKIFEQEHGARSPAQNSWCFQQ